MRHHKSLSSLSGGCYCRNDVNGIEEPENVVTEER